MHIGCDFWDSSHPFCFMEKTLDLFSLFSMELVPCTLCFGWCHLVPICIVQMHYFYLFSSFAFTRRMSLPALPARLAKHRPTDQRHLLLTLLQRKIWSCQKSLLLLNHRIHLQNRYMCLKPQAAAEGAASTTSSTPASFSHLLRYLSNWFYGSFML